MEAAYPQEDTDETREGTAAHWVLAELLHGRVVEVGTLDPDGTPVDRDMILAAREMTAAVLSVPITGSPLQVESRVHMRQAVHPDNWGTCDAFLIDIPGRVIYVWDYKYGHGYVSEQGNWQLTDYAAGVKETHNLEGEYSVVMTIFQPRYYGPEGQLRSYHMPAAEFSDRVDTLRMAAKLVSPNAAATTGDWCFHCNGRVACQAFQRQTNRMGSVTLATTDTAPTPALAGLELLWLREASAYLKARTSALEELIRVQPEGSGFVLEQGYGREKWTEDAEAVFALGDAMGLDLRKPPEAITPAQAVKLGLDPEVKDAYSTKPRGEVKLVPAIKSRVVAAFQGE